MEKKIKIIKSIGALTSFALFVICFALSFLGNDDFCATDETMPLSVITTYLWCKFVTYFDDAPIFNICAFVSSIWLFIQCGFYAVVVCHSFYSVNICNFVFFGAFFALLFCEYAYKNFEKNYKTISIISILTMSSAFVWYVSDTVYNVSHLAVMTIALVEAVLLSLCFRCKELSHKKYVISREENQEVDENGIKG